MKSAARKILVAMCLVGMVSLTVVHAQQDTSVNDKDMIVSDFEDIGYPPLARQTRTQGVVVIRVRLGKSGAVTDAVALSGSDLLMPASAANAKKWRFQPNAQATAIIVYNFRTPQVACKSSFSMLQAPNFVTIIGCDVPVEP
jgi:TonB family protein